MTPVSAGLSGALGEPLAQWLVATRGLRGAVVMLEERTRGELSRERPPGRQGTLEREIGHAELQAAIFETRKRGEQWREQGRALSEDDRGRARNLGLELDELLGDDALFELPWRTDDDVDYVQDRSAEMDTILAGCAAASSVLATVDGRLSAAEGAPYR